MASPEVNHLTSLSVSLILSIMENDATLTKIVIFEIKEGKKLYNMRKKQYLCNALRMS